MSSNSSNLDDQLFGLAQRVESASYFVMIVAVLLTLLLLVHTAVLVYEEIDKCRESKKKAVKVPSVGPKKRQKVTKSKTSKSSKASKSSKRSRKRAKSISTEAKKSSSKVSKSSVENSKGAAPEPVVAKPAPNAPGIAQPPKVESSSHVTFVNVKDTSTPTAPKYQIVEAKWPDVASATPPIPFSPNPTPISTRSDVSASSKQFHDSKCPGTGSFGTSASSFSSITSQSVRPEHDDLVLPPSNEALTQGTYFTYDMLKASPSKAVPPLHQKIFNRDEVPTAFNTEGVVTAKEDTETMERSLTAQSPHSTTLGNLASSKSETMAPTQLSSTKSETVAPTQSSVSIASTQATPSDIKSAASSSTLSVANTQASEISSTPNKT